MRQYSKDMDYNEAVLLTQELVRIPSHKDVEDRESKVAEFIYAYCKEKGLYPSRRRKRRSLLLYSFVCCV
jgi:acetylornithine deacetylase/succinyl-diaminopimelate desuccinylase-like protein